MRIFGNGNGKHRMPDRIRITIRQVLGISVTGLFAACIDHFRLNTLDLAERSRCIDFRIIFKPGFYGTTIAERYGFRIFLRFSLDRKSVV